MSVSQPRLRVFAGPNGSGKSTLKEVLPESLLGVYVNADEIEKLSSLDKRAEVMHEWHKRLLHEVVPKLLERWAPRLGVQVSSYFLQRMKTQWGSCNPRLGNIRLNTELVK